MRISYIPMQPNYKKYQNKNNANANVNAGISNSVKKNDNLYLISSASYISFKGVNIENIIEKAKDQFSLITTNATQDFQDKMQELRDRYKKRRENVEGLFYQRKINKLYEEENNKIKGFQLAQELFIEEQDAIIEIIENQQKILEALNASEDDKIALELALIKERKTKEIMQTLMAASDSKDEKKGFNKIAGYEYEKFVLTNEFINPISRETAGENVKVPNAVLFYGPVANGKTTFAKAFAEAAGCELIQIRGKGQNKTEREQSVIDQLTEVSEKTQEAFMKARLEGNMKKPMRKIILLDEFDGIANSQSSITGQLKDFMETCSKEYHVTLFLTTNNPMEIISPIRSHRRISVNVNLDPPNSQNASSVLQYYLNNLPKEKVDFESINYEQLVNKLLSVYPESAYNNSQIEEIVNRCCQDSGGKITQDDIIYQIKKMKPVINKEKISAYNDAKKILNPERASNNE